MTMALLKFNTPTLTRREVLAIPYCRSTPKQGEKR